MLSTQSGTIPARTYTVTQNVLSHPDAEGVYVIPNPPCTFCGNAFCLAEQQPTHCVWLYPISDFVVPPNWVATLSLPVSHAEISQTPLS